MNSRSMLSKANVLNGIISLLIALLLVGPISTDVYIAIYGQGVRPAQISDYFINLGTFLLLIIIFFTFFKLVFKLNTYKVSLVINLIYTIGLIFSLALIKSSGLLLAIYIIPVYAISVISLIFSILAVKKINRGLLAGNLALARMSMIFSIIIFILLSIIALGSCFIGLCFGILEFL